MPNPSLGFSANRPPSAGAERDRHDGAIHDQSGGGDEGETDEAGIGGVNHYPSACADDEHWAGNPEQGPERPSGGLECRR
jgi:hypothetical protein